MLPQSTFMVLAPVADGRREALQALLDGMNLVPPLADPANPLVPFGQFDRLHFARFVIARRPAVKWTFISRCGQPAVQD